MGRKVSIGILGAGFGGLYTAFHLERLLGPDIEITLFDRNNYLLYTPMLHEVAAGSVNARHVVVPIRKLLRTAPVRFRCEEVVRIHLAEKAMDTAGGRFGFDYLVLAPGSEANFYGVGGVKQQALTFKTIADAIALRNGIIEVLERGSLERNPDRRNALLTINVAGAGCTGVEVVTEIAQFIHLILETDYPEIDRSEVSINLIEASGTILTSFPPYLSQIALNRLTSLGITVHLKSPLEEVTAEAVCLRGGRQVPRGLLVWTGGVKARPVPLDPDVPRDTSERIGVSGFLEIPAYPGIYAIGDGAHADGEGPALPCTASVAVQQARYVARSIRAHLRKKAVEPFRFHYRGDMASLGFMSGVCEVYGWQIRGLAAWLIWKGFKLAMLPRHKNRFQILSDWIITWLFKRDTSRFT